MTWKTGRAWDREGERGKGEGEKEARGQREERTSNEIFSLLQPLGL